MIEVWLLGTAVVFTVFGYIIGKTQYYRKTTEVVIDTLIAQGYLRTRINKNGETEILKVNNEQ
jgi:hypothetical protein